MKLFALIVLSVFALPAFANYSLLLKDVRYPERPFTVRVENVEGIAALESYFMKGRVPRDENGNPEIGIVNGSLIHATRSSSHDWDFALNPSDVSFADMTIELCDGQFTDIENDPDYWFSTVGQFCPWSTRSLVQEIRKNGKVIFRR